MKSLLYIVICFISLNATDAQMLSWKRILETQWGINSYAISPTNHHIYVSCCNNELFRSQDLGESYDTLTIPASSFENLAVTYDGTIIGSIFSGGLAISSDGGEQWVNKFDFSKIRNFFIDGNTVWGSYRDINEIVFSTNQGIDWITKSSPYMYSPNILAAKDSFVFVGSYNEEYFRSTDMGETWHSLEISGDGIILIDSMKTIWLESDFHLHYSTDMGLSWKQGAAIEYPSNLMFDKYNNLYHWGNFNNILTRSTDFGTTWDSIYAFFPKSVTVVDSLIFINKSNELYYHSNDLQFIPGRDLCPMAVGNKYQYFYRSSSLEYNIYDLKILEIVKDSLIDGKRYFMYDDDPALFRYDTLENILYKRDHQNIDFILSDFSLIPGSMFMQYGTSYVTALADSMIFFDKMRKSGGWKNIYTGGSSYNYYLDGLGYSCMESYYSGMGPDSHSYERLINAIIQDENGNFVFYTNGYKPVIVFDAWTVIDTAGQKSFSLFVDHEYSGISFHIGSYYEGALYTDSVWIELFYKSDSVTTATEIYQGERVPVSLTYDFIIPVDTTLLSAGYKMNYRIGARDISFVPQISYSPSNGYHEAGYSPIVNIASGEKKYSYSLQQNYPNPFNPSTRISFTIPERTFVKLSVFNILGQQITVLINEELAEGEYSRDFNAAGLGSGIYICKLETGGFSEVRKMLYLK